MLILRGISHKNNQINFLQTTRCYFGVNIRKLISYKKYYIDYILWGFPKIGTQPALCVDMHKLELRKCIILSDKNEIRMPIQPKYYMCISSLR